VRFVPLPALNDPGMDATTAIVAFPAGVATSVPGSAVTSRAPSIGTWRDSPKKGARGTRAGWQVKARAEERAVRKTIVLDYALPTPPTNPLPPVPPTAQPPADVPTVGGADPADEKVVESFEALSAYASLLVGGTRRSPATFNSLSTRLATWCRAHDWVDEIHIQSASMRAAREAIFYGSAEEREYVEGLRSTEVQDSIDYLNEGAAGLQPVSRFARVARRYRHDLTLLLAALTTLVLGVSLALLAQACGVPVVYCRAFFVYTLLLVLAIPLLGKVLMWLFLPVRGVGWSLPPK